MKNIKKTYNIGSKIIEVHYGQGPASKILEKELSLYRLSELSPSIIIKINGKNKKKIISRSPKIHGEFKNGFICNFNDCSVSWERRGKILYVNFIFDEYKKNWFRKFRGIQYTHPFEDVGQVFHELVLVPSLYFFSRDISLIHGSSVSNSKGEVVLFTGTGGVGKTFIELESILKHGYSFLADDISILGNNGKIYSNFAFPKIYDYNTIGEKYILEKIFENRNMLDKFSWFFKNKVLHSTVRRRINPFKFFRGKICYEGNLSKLFFVFPSSISSPSLNLISPDKAAKMNIDILKSEYAIFHKYLYWHRFNRSLLNMGLLLDIDNVFNDWFYLQKKVLSNVACYLMKVPISDLKRKESIRSLINTTLI